jgi:plastocyanin
LIDSYNTFSGALIEEAGSIQIEAEQTIPAWTTLEQLVQTGECHWSCPPHQAGMHGVLDLYE